MGTAAEAWFMTEPLLPFLTIMAVAATAAFTLIYFGFAGLSLLFTKIVFPRIGIGAVVDTRPLRPGQITKEIRNSIVSTFIFGGLGALTAALIRAGWLEISWSFSAPRFLAECAALFLWNEVHFYICHYILHGKYLFPRVHRIHHESVTPTPFSTYSMHWVEAAMLGSVMVTAMLFYNFSVYALMSLPIMSLIGNSIGHSNYELFPKRAEAGAYSASREHGMHHRRASGNFGFLLPFFDRFMRTEVRPSDRSST